MPPKVESSECAVVAAAFPQLQISVRPADACCTLISQSVNITCTDENRITGLWIRSRAVTGPIPMSMFQLTSLTDLTLSDTGVVGAIPSDISLLTNLERLTLLNNAGINGAIPSEIYALPKLSNLVAIGSRLSGSLTSSISNLQSLIELRLDRNSLEGSIPTELGSLPLLQEISIQANMFRGAIPNEINNLRALRLFDGRTNYLWGTVPSGLESVARAARCNIGTDCVRLSANCFDTKDLAVNWSNATRRPDSECAPYLPTNITPTDSSPIPTQTNSVAIGVGVGLTLLFILTALTAFLIYKRKTPSTPTPTKLESSPPSHLPAWLVNATREPSLPSWVMMPVTSVAGWKRTEKGKEREKPLTPVEGGERGLSVVHTMENKEEEKSEGLVDEKKGGLFAIANGEAAATKSLTATFPQTMTTVPPPTSKSATSSGSLFPVPADAPSSSESGRLFGSLATSPPHRIVEGSEKATYTPDGRMVDVGERLGVVSMWGVEDVEGWLQEVGLRQEVVEVLKAQDLNGYKLLLLSDSQLTDMGVQSSAARAMILIALRELRGEEGGGSSSMDPVLVIGEDGPPEYSVGTA